MPRIPRRAGSALLALAATLAVAGCAQRPASLDTARSAIQSARADADVNTYAAAELDAAQRELQSANQAWEEGEGRDEAAHRAALALQQVEIARATAEARKSQAQTEDLGGERERALRAAAERQVQELQQQLASLQARQSERGIVLTVGDVLFDVGQATLKPGAITEITRLAQFLQENPDRAVRIEGHTDSTGSIETNLVLSQRRADSVANALIAAGVDPARIVPVGLGPDFPIASNATVAGRQQNRRVEVVIENPPATAAARPGQAAF
jgi:outer membrane protein OmpA-like peptidoglycan-associated protein